jgi:hypothetical protein
MINPSEINLESLPCLPLEEKASFPDTPGIYIAIDSLGDIQYIGRANNIKKRWLNHHKYSDLLKLGNIRIHYKVIEDEKNLTLAEKQLIKHFQPPLNNVWHGIKATKGRRKPVAYRIDELVLEVLAKLAREENSSVNRYIEKHFFVVGKERGLIDKDEELLGETRGGGTKNND